MTTKIERAAIEAVATGTWSTVVGLVKAEYPEAVERARRARDRRREAARWGRTPAWARRLIQKHANGLPPEVSWHRSRYSDQSSGRCSYSRIHVTEGRDPRDARYVLLHEIAHWNAPVFNHDADFYDILTRLARAEGLLRYGQVRDGRNMKAAARRARQGGK